MKQSGYIADFATPAMLGTLAMDPVEGHPGGGGSVERIERPAKPGPVIDHPGGGTVKQTLHATNDSSEKASEETASAQKGWSVPRRNMWILLGGGLLTLLLIHSLSKDD